MSQPTITVEIPLGGSPTVSVDGCPGPSCKDLTAKLEKALGSPEAMERTADYAKAERTANRVKAR